jgi:outer membrane protein OmpA-like peptidoglycan-associated protein
MNLKKALLAATMLALPLTAQAQPISGLYVGAGAGLNGLQPSDLQLSGADYAQLMDGAKIGKAEFDLGFAAVMSVGWGFGNGFRAEVEGSYRENNVNSVNGFGFLPGEPRGSGPARSYGIMANALYDFDLGAAMPLVPYVGLGIGYIWHAYDVRIVDRTPPIGSTWQNTINDNQGRFAYQAIAGVALPVDDIVPGLAITAEYRFLGTAGHELSNRERDHGQTLHRGKAEVENVNHSLMIGLRYAFNAAAPSPAPVAAPAAAPAPARTFLVFFDFDRADLTDRARAIIAEAAQNAQRTGSARIEVAGHADRSGTPQYNQRLSERRAQAVAAELERRGVARSAMTIQAFGESRPLVPTADGVREPQNRRVEIVLR